jgi:site-specific DNA recombinase
MSTQDTKIDNLTFPVTERALIYARVSGDDRKYSTSGIEGQLADCRKYAGDKGYNLVGEYFEEPNKQTSGYDMLPELDKILKLAEQQTFDVLIVREIDRLARNRFKQMSVENRLDELGIRVEYVIGQFEDSTEGRLLKGLMSEFAEYERGKIEERTERGRVNAVSKGNVIIGGSKAPYGYDVKKQNGVRVLVINEQEAVIVRLIFDLYVNKNYTLNDLADYLDSHNIAKPAKGNNHKNQTHKDKVKGWSTGTIGGILGNETYIGRWYYGKTKTIKDKLTGKRKHVKRPKEEWLMVNVPPILNDDIFQEAQKRKESNKRAMGKHRKNNYLLGGMCKCGHCNNSMSGLTKKKGNLSYYKCNSAHLPKRYKFKCKNSKLYKLENVESVVWNWIKSILLDEDYLHQVLSEYQQEQLKAQQPVINLIEANKAKIEKLQTEKSRLIDAYTTGVLSLDDIAPKKTELEKELSDLTQATSQLQTELAPTNLTEDEIDYIKLWSTKIRQGLDNVEQNFEAKRKIVTILRLQVTLTEDDKGQWADIQCVLGDDHLPTNYTTTRCIARGGRL